VLSTLCLAHTPCFGFLGQSAAATASASAQGGSGAAAEVDGGSSYNKQQLLLSELSTALKVNAQLTSLDLSHCDVGDTGVEVLCSEMLQPLVDAAAVGLYSSSGGSGASMSQTGMRCALRRLMLLGSAANDVSRGKATALARRIPQLSLYIS
jgi:hypothetical protein